MIKVIVKHRKEAYDNGGTDVGIVGFHCEGHSGYGQGGPDIVCAAVSVLMDTIERGMRDLPKYRPSDLTIRIGAKDNTVSYDCENMLLLVSPLFSLFEAVRLSLMAIAAEYPDEVSFQDIYV